MVSKHREKCENIERCRMFKKYLEKIKQIENLDDWFDQIASLMGTVETLYSRKSTKYEFFQQLLKPPTIKELISYKKSAEIQL